MNEAASVRMVSEILDFNSKFLNPRDPTNAANKLTIRRKIVWTEIQDGAEEARDRSQCQPEDRRIVIAGVNTVLDAEFLGKGHILPCERWRC